MKARGWRRRALAWTLVALLAGRAPAEPINTTLILSETVAAVPGCLHYCFVGICFWLVCGWTCHIRTTPKIFHYNPDLYVSAFAETGHDPWVEIRATLGLATEATAVVGGGLFDGWPIGGGRPSSEGTQPDTGAMFHEVNVIGHPLLGLLGSADTGESYFCPSQAQPFQPYLISTLDALAWRYQIPELLYPQSWVPGMREIGPWPLLNWGAVYPRSGFATAPEAPKAAAIVAQRAGDIVTRLGQPHVYSSVIRPLGQGVWPPGPLLENQPLTGMWSMLTPLPQPYCAAFAQDDSSVGPGWAAGRGAPDGMYAFTLWRPYACCIQRRGIFLYSIDFPPICVI